MSIHSCIGRGARVIYLVTLLLLLAWTSPAVFASKCKGMSTSQCQNNDACTWVSGYTSKQGKKVDAYCRQKASKSSRNGEKKDQASSKSAKKSDKKGKADKKSKKDEKSKSDKKKAQKSSKDTKE